ncbi:uncharacterized protein BO80DRAFT_481863 [Aspergillus ibericus CBS 121593]|uniref:Secreted protein n=1 Tax=Aspergillus ibericus CBS 121593 TaxID=1448316 RepID=A0A395GQU4_9EURO|nr:hypothetical protein BO80DRAFT_481863 [Aspergillus ibericus CBS 121593]RAK97766.1 hypothetical protein BO80DRAFT_481863 [Aspergillus ibericus CBS 121593]
MLGFVSGVFTVFQTVSLSCCTVSPRIRHGAWQKYYIEVRYHTLEIDDDISMPAVSDQTSGALTICILITRDIPIALMMRSD